MSQLPTSGTWKQGQRIYNSSPVAGGSVGWVCVTSGTLANQWQAETLYEPRETVSSNGNVYECVNPGLSGKTAPTGTDERVSDGAMLWAYVGTQAVFRSFGLISTN